MKYLPTIDLWSGGIHRALITGALKLQCGQWVVCGKGNRPARFVTVKSDGRSGSIWVAHSEGDRKTTRSFPRLCRAAGKGKEGRLAHAQVRERLRQSAPV